jgi:hypothetical protein
MNFDSTTRRGNDRRRRPILTAVVLTATAVSVGWLCVVLFPGPLPTPQDPDYLDNLFDSREVVWIGRLLLAFGTVVLVIAGAFVAASTVVRMRRGDWLKRAGPFEVSEQMGGQTERGEDGAEGASHDADDEVTDLRVRLAITSELMEKIQHDWTR